MLKRRDDYRFEELTHIGESANALATQAKLARTFDFTFAAAVIKSRSLRCGLMAIDELGSIMLMMMGMRAPVIMGKAEVEGAVENRKLCRGTGALAEGQAYGNKNCQEDAHMPILVDGLS